MSARKPPDAAAVARRVIALAAVTHFAFTVPRRDHFERWKAAATPEDLRKFRAVARSHRMERIAALGRWSRILTAEEARVFARTAESLTEREQINASWRVESLYVLAWALGLRDSLPPFDTQVNPEKDLGGLPPDDRERFESKAKLRSRREINKARDVAELWHWRSRTYQLASSGEPPFKDDPVDGFQSYDDIVKDVAAGVAREGLFVPIKGDFPALGKPYRALTERQWHSVSSIASERHFALNWLCGLAPRNSWEQTPTDT
jgi:hypothetical protein